MHNHHLSIPLVSLTAVATATLMLACTPSQQPEQNSLSTPPVLLETKQKPADTELDTRLRAVTADDSITQELVRKEHAARAVPSVPLYEDTSMPASTAYGAAVSLQSLRAPSEPVNRENYAHFDDNSVKLVAEAPVSTFSIDVDTGAYSNVRRMLNNGQLPVEDAVRVEELINYFSYDYPLPKNSKQPFAVTTEIGVSPWNPATHILHIGIKGYDVSRAALPASNLVFLVDVSG